MTVGDACSLTFLLLMADAVVLVEQIGQMVSKLIGRVPATGTASEAGFHLMSLDPPATSLEQALNHTSHFRLERRIVAGVHVSPNFLHEIWIALVQFRRRLLGLLLLAGPGVSSGKVA